MDALVLVQATLGTCQIKVWTPAKVWISAKVWSLAKHSCCGVHHQTWCQYSS